MTTALLSTPAAALAAFAAVGLSYAGMAGLCLAMDRHHAQLWRREPAPALRRGLRAAGSALLLVAAWPCVALWGGSVGFVVWLGCLSAGALLLVGLLPYAPRAAALAAMVAPGLALMCGLFV